MHTAPRPGATGPATTAGVVAVLILALGLAGCGGAADTATQQAADDAVAKAAGTGTAGDVDPDTNGGTDGGEANHDGGGRLPEGFPTDQVPLVDGGLVGGSKQVEDGNTRWSANIRVEGDIADIGPAAQERLADAGFSTDKETTTNGSQLSYYSYVMSDDTYRVNLSASTSGDGQVVVGYIVTPVPTS